MFLDLKRKEKRVIILNIDDKPSYFNLDYNINYEESYNKVLKELNKMYWYDKKVYQLLEGNESVAKLSRKTNIPYHSLYNTYRKVLDRLKKLL
jgi:transposase-like protein